MFCHCGGAAGAISHFSYITFSSRGKFFESAMSVQRLTKTMQQDLEVLSFLKTRYFKIVT